MTLARRIATPRGGLIALALGATVAFFALLTTVEQACGECAAPSLSTGAPDVIAPVPTPAHAARATPTSAAEHPPHRSAPTHAGKPVAGTAEQAAQGAPQPTPAPSEAAPEQPSPPGSPLAQDVSGAANYVRAFYADLAKGDYESAWPRLASDLRGGGFDAWRKGFATTVSQSTSPITAKSAGAKAALVSLTLTAVDRDKCGHEVERHFAVTWRLALSDGKWSAEHASARPVGKAPTALVATC